MTITENSFNGLQKLKGLSFFDNNLLELPSNIFLPLVNLEILGVSNQQLTVIHADSFGLHRNLTSIALQGNQINSIDERILDKTAVTKLFMDQNQCSSVDSFSRDQIRQNLRQCFYNYQPRIAAGFSITKPQPQSTIQPSFVTLSSITNNFCGQRVTGHGNIIGGTKIGRGEFPW